MACTTVVVGRDASSTGKVLVAHNEDNPGMLVMAPYIVPGKEHKAGENLKFEEGRAVIPQVERTFSYIWIETKSPSGASFGDFFINQWGVSITSDSCWASREILPDLTDGGIGYGLRRILAERSRSAREAVSIAVNLIEKYGYFSSGRSYQIADADEAWVLQIVMGRNYVAQRVPDDEVMVIPNHYTIRNIDFNDKKRFIVSPNLVQNALDNGWYSPKSDDFSDFDFAKVYQRSDRFEIPYNTLRQSHAIKMLGGEYQGGALPFSFKTDHKVSIEDLMDLMRSHYEGTENFPGYDDSFHFGSTRTICTSTSQASIALELNSNPMFSILWLALGRPCLSPYVPFYCGIENFPSSYSWGDSLKAVTDHFSPSSSDYGYDSDRAWWAFTDLQTAVEPFYGWISKNIKSSISEMENLWLSEVRSEREKLQFLYSRDPSKCRDLMTSMSGKRASTAVKMARNLLNELKVLECQFMQREISLKDKDSLVKIVIRSDKGFDASTIDSDSLLLGAGYNNPWENWAMSEDFALKDIDGDGDVDGVISFRSGDFLHGASSGVVSLWLTGKTADGSDFIARGFLEYVN